MTGSAFRENLDRECAAILLGGGVLCPRYKIPQSVCVALGAVTSIARLPFFSLWTYRVQLSLDCPHVAVSYEYWYERQDREAAQRARKGDRSKRKAALRYATAALNVAEIARAQARGYVRAVYPERYGALVLYFWTGRTRRWHPKKQAYVPAGAVP